MSQQHEPEPEPFKEREPFKAAMTSAAVAAGAGTFVSAIQNSMQKHDKGAMGIFTRTGSTIGLLTAMGGVFSYTDGAVANFRAKDDPLNGAAGGCAAGFVAGAHARSLPMMAGGCLALGMLMGSFDAAGKSIVGTAAKASPADATAGQDDHEGQHAPSWREERDRRRRGFFKQEKEVDQE